MPYFDCDNYIENSFPNNFYIYGVVTDLKISKDGPDPQSDDEIIYNSSITIKDSDNNEVELLVGSGSFNIINTLERVNLGQLVMAYGYLTSPTSSSFKNEVDSNDFELRPVAIGINTPIGDKSVIEDYENYEKPPYQPPFEEPYDDYYGNYNNEFYDPATDDPLADMPNTNDPEVLRRYAIDNPEIPDDYFEP